MNRYTGLTVALNMRDGAEGLALAGAIAMAVNAVLTLGWARARFGGPALGPLVDAFGRSALIALAAGLAARGIAPLAADAVAGTGEAKLAAVVELTAGGAVFAVVAGIGVATFADASTRESALRVLRRLGIGR